MKRRPTESEMTAAAEAVRETAQTASLAKTARKLAKTTLKAAEKSLKKADKQASAADELARAAAKQLAKLQVRSRKLRVLVADDAPTPPEIQAEAAE